MTLDIGQRGGPVSQATQLSVAESTLSAAAAQGSPLWRRFAAFDPAAAAELHSQFVQLRDRTTGARRSGESGPSSLSSVPGAAGAGNRITGSEATSSGRTGAAAQETHIAIASAASSPAATATSSGSAAPTQSPAPPTDMSAPSAASDANADALSAPYRHALNSLPPRLRLDIEAATAWASEAFPFVLLTALLGVCEHSEGASQPAAEARHVVETCLSP